MYELRPYQSDLKRKIYLEWSKGSKRVLAQMPTGGGKTLLFSDIVREIGCRALVLAHREELIVQAASKLEVMTGERPGVIKAGSPFEPEKRVQVASVQTLMNDPLKAGHFDLIVVDEAHHTPAKSYESIIGAIAPDKVLGVTATPCRTTGKGLGDIFDSLVCGPSVMGLITGGYLSPFTMYAAKDQMSTNGVRATGGDYNLKQLSEQNNVKELAGSIIAHYKRFAEGKRCIVFAINCEHSRFIAKAYNQAGISAAHLDGNSSPEERKETLAKFASGEIKVLSNVALFTEGFDLPEIDAVQIARPTRSLSLWLQMLGRGLRLAEGKDKAILIDHTDGWEVHGVPDRYREWRLDVGTVQSKTTKASKDEFGENVDVEIHEIEAELVEVNGSLLEVIFEQEERIRTGEQRDMVWVWSAILGCSGLIEEELEPWLCEGFEDTPYLPGYWHGKDLEYCSRPENGDSGQAIGYVIYRYRLFVESWRTGRNCKEPKRRGGMPTLILKKTLNCIRHGLPYLEMDGRDKSSKERNAIIRSGWQFGRRLSAVYRSYQRKINKLEIAA